MPYIPRPTTTVSCAHCGSAFASRNLRRKYCSNSCNVLASYARNGRKTERVTKADLENAVTEMKGLIKQLKREQLKADMKILKATLATPDTPRTPKASTKRS